MGCCPSRSPVSNAHPDPSRRAICYHRWLPDLVHGLTELARMDWRPRFRVARNPDAESRLPYLIWLPIEGGVVLKAREVWGARRRRSPCHSRVAEFRNRAHTGGHARTRPSRETRSGRHWTSRGIQKHIKLWRFGTLRHRGSNVISRRRKAGPSVRLGLLSRPRRNHRHRPRL
jgi:hypothetical protein